MRRLFGIMLENYDRDKLWMILFVSVITGWITYFAYSLEYNAPIEAKNDSVIVEIVYNQLNIQEQAQEVEYGTKQEEVIRDDEEVKKEEKPVFDMQFDAPGFENEPQKAQDPEENHETWDLM
ncbi:MAG: hypothetical protein ACOC2M_01755 [bacterium]